MSILRCQYRHPRVLISASWSTDIGILGCRYLAPRVIASVVTERILKFLRLLLWHPGIHDDTEGTEEFLRLPLTPLRLGCGKESPRSFGYPARHSVCGNVPVVRESQGTSAQVRGRGARAEAQRTQP